MVSAKPLTVEQDAQPAVTEPATRRSEGTQTLTHGRVIACLFLILERGSIQLSQLAGPTFAQLMHLHQVLHGLAFDIGRQKFFEARSFSAALSSIASASRRFSLPFSVSSVRSRWASDTVIPPNLAFSL